MLDLLDGEAFARGDVDARLAELPPVGRHPSGFWWALRHADCDRIVRDTETFSSARGTGYRSQHDAGDQPPDFESLNGSDGEVHDRLRRALRAAWAASDAAWLAARAAELVEGLRERGGGDVVKAIAEPLPLEAFGRALGVDTGELGSATRQIARHGDATCRAPGQSARDAYLEGERRLWALIDGWMSAPPDGVIARLVAAPGIDARDLAYLIRLVCLTAHHSTALAIGGAFLAMAEHGDIGDSADEVLRWTSPIVRFGRYVQRDTELGGQHLRRGDRVVAVFRAANRDLHVFADPHRFVPDRSPNPHVAFGAGPHACFGAHVARQQIAAVLTAMRGIRVRVVSPPRLLVSSVSSGPLALRVELR